MIIKHLPQFKEGTRVLLMNSRSKDGADKSRSVVRVSHGPTKFDEIVADFVRSWRPGYRIYVTASERTVDAAIRLFKERQLAADYDPDRTQFYKAINARWASCLMNERAQYRKMYLFDCDAPGDEDAVMEELRKFYSRSAAPYSYATKNGSHVITDAFDTSLLSDRVKALIHRNPVMLWGYNDEQ